MSDTEARPVVDRDALAEVFSRHRYALGHEGILSDGEYAWLECTCGFKQNLALPQDDIRIAEAAWERHLADAVLTVVQDAADVRRAVAEECIAAIAASSAVFASDAMRVIARNAGLMP